MLVLFGQSSGVVPPLDLSRSAASGSLYLTRPSLAPTSRRATSSSQSARALFEVVDSGAVKIDVGQTYALRDAAAAHRDLEARQTTGSTVLLP